MLTMEASDFMISKDTYLKDCQAYTLVHCLLHAEGGRYRDTFFRFARSAWEGNASMSEFRDALDESLEMERDDFELAWTAYAEQQAGAGR